MTTPSNRQPKLDSHDEGRHESSLPGSATGVAGLIPLDSSLNAERESAATAAPTNTSNRRQQAKPPARRVWWPIALLIAIVAGVIIVSAARPGRMERGSEPEPGSHGAEKLPEKIPGVTPERAP
jgi:hypothetical protein